MSLSSLTKQITSSAHKHAPTILTATGVVGVLQSSWMLHEATKKAQIDIFNEETQRIEPLSFLEKVELTWRYYAPAAVLQLSSLGLFVAANAISVKRQAAMLALYTISEAGFAEYQQKVIETVGKAKDGRIRDAIAQDQMDRNPPDGTIVLEGTEVLCHDPLSGRYWKSGMEDIRKAVNNINAEINTNGYASQNDFYGMVGLEPVVMGDNVGWNYDHLLDVHFSSTVAPDGRPALSIQYRNTPKLDYYRFR